MPGNRDDGAAYGQKRLSWIDRLTIRKRVALAGALIAQQAKNLPDRPLTVLETGCGYHALNLRILQERFPAAQFHGVDLHITDNPQAGITLMQADITQWQPAAQVEVVLSLAVVEHLLDPLQHFQLIADALLPHGAALLTTPTPPNHAVWGNLTRIGLMHDHIDEHKLYLTHAGIRLLAERAGLAIVSYQTFQFGLNQCAVLRRQGADS